ncbi:MAG: inositol monophosphatase family protein [Microgenomates group bacterium]|jgi:myo-inositol-1(or 4)-monophosphatase
MERAIEKNYKNWPLVSEDQSLKTAIEISLKAGKILRTAFYKGVKTHLYDDKSNYTKFDGMVEMMAKKAIRNLQPDSKILGEEYSKDEDVSGKKFWTVDGVDGTTNFATGIPIFNFTIGEVVDGKTRSAVVYDPINHNCYYSAEGEKAYRNGQPLNVSNHPFEECLLSFAPLRNVRKGRGYYEKELVEALWSGMKDITNRSGRFHRELQSGGLELSFVASGILDGYASSWTSPYDLAPGALIARRAGATVTNMQGLDWHPMIEEAAPGTVEKKWRPNYWGVIAGNPMVQPKMLEIFQKYLPEDLIVNPA